MAEKRKHPRHRQPTLVIRTEGACHKTRDWSLGGFRLERFHQALAPKERITGTIALGRFGERGDFVAEVVRVSADSGIGLRILEISPQVFLSMGAFKNH